MIRRASVGTVFLTVFLDLLGFGLVMPYLPGVARTYGASDFVATLLGSSYSLMQFLFVSRWGQLSDRTGRRPVLVISVAASVVGFLLLANATSLWMLFAARIWNGIATSNLSVAQAYIADVTRPEDRSKGMGVIGAGIGLGFVLGPPLGGLLEAYSPLSRPGALPAYAGVALASVNLILAIAFLPESLPPEKRGALPQRPSVFDRERYRAALSLPGVGLAMAVNFVLVLSFSGMEQTFRLFTEDEFRMTTAGTASVLLVVGLVLIAVQGGLLRYLTPLASERVLARVGVFIQVAGFLGLALSPRAPWLSVLYLSMGTIAFGSALTNPSLPALVSRSCDPQRQGLVLGVFQSAGAFARVCGPALGGLLYGHLGHSAPYLVATGGMLLAGTLSFRLRQPTVPDAPAEPLLAGESVSKSPHP